MAVVELADVAYTYPKKSTDVTIRAARCAIEAKEFVGIAGPNGSGKTTLCRLMSGQIPHFFGGEPSGILKVNGIDTTMSSHAELAEHVGFLFENPHDQLTGSSVTVLEEVAFALENSGTPRPELLRRAHVCLEKVGLTGLDERHPMHLSGGQIQRLALASVLAAGPEILILDDPISQMDTRGAKEVFDLLAALRGEGHTIIVVSHDLDLLTAYCDRLLLMHAGEIMFDGRPEEVFEQASEQRYPLPTPELLGLRARAMSAGLVSADTTPGQLFSAVENASSVATGPDPTPHLQKLDVSDSSVALDDVEFVYPNGQRALDGVCARMDGGCVSLIGTNGAGKSTLTRLFNGLLRPTAGVVRLFDEQTTKRKVSELARDVGLAFQNPDDQLFRRTVELEVAFGPQNLQLGEDSIRRLTDEALAMMNLLDVRDVSPYDLDYCRRRHVAIASVIAMGTPIVVLDEPTSGQDALGTAMIGSAVRRLVDERRLVVVVTHDARFAREHSDRVIALREGRVVADGAPREVLGRSDLFELTGVDAPLVTRLSAALGLGDAVLTMEEFVARVERHRGCGSDSPPSEQSAVSGSPTPPEV